MSLSRGVLASFFYLLLLLLLLLLRCVLLYYGVCVLSIVRFFKPWSLLLAYLYFNCFVWFERGGKGRSDAAECVISSVKRSRIKSGRKRKCARLLCAHESWGYQSRAELSSSGG